MDGKFNKNKVNRREFLRKSLLLGIVAGSSAQPLAFLNDTFARNGPDKKVDLAVVEGNPAAAVRRALDILGGIKRFVRPGDRVVLKPNISFPNPPHLASTTHPQLVAAVAKECIRAKARKILILDYPLRDPGLCLKRTGVLASCQKLEKTYVLGITEKKFFKKVMVPEGKVLKEVEIMRDVLESDLVINLPVAKSHGTTTVSLGMKNLMGLIWDRRSFHAQMDINHAIADLAMLIKPKLTIIDASRVLMAGGPSGPGPVATLNKVVAGVDPVAVDAYGATLCPWDQKRFTGREIRHIAAAHDNGLGTIDLDCLTIKKERV